MHPSTPQVVRRHADALQYRQMDDMLQNAIERADLPELVAHFYPDSGAQPGRKGVVFAVWRGDEHESFSLFRAAGGRWLYYDHRTRETGNTFGFLVDICGLSKAEAAAQLKARGVGEEVRSPSGRRRGKARVQAGDAVFDALRRAVTERRVVPFVHSLSQETLSREAARSCVASALETPTGDNQRLLEAAHGALKEIARRKRKAQREGKPVAFYDYEDEQGRLLYQVVRFDPKGFSQRRPYGDGWAWGITEGCYVRGDSGTLTLDDAAKGDAERIPLDACRLVLYRLPQVIAAVKAGLAIHVVEGEEDVHALEQLGLVATCNAGGAGKWQGAYSNTLRGATVIVVPDFDEAGEDHARRVYGELTGVAKRLRIVRLPGLPPAGDVRDWLTTHDRQQLIAQLARLGPSEV